MKINVSYCSYTHGENNVEIAVRNGCFVDMLNELLNEFYNYVDDNDIEGAQIVDVCECDEEEE